MNNEFAIPEFREKLSQWLEKNKIAAFVTIIAIVLVMAAIFIFDYVQDKRQINSSMLAENIQEKYKDWLQLEENEREDEELNMLISQALEEYPGDFVAQRAIYTQGLMAIEKKEWKKAATAFVELSDKWPKSYLAPTSLSNLAAVKEEMGEIEEALEILAKLVDEYSSISPDAPEATFNLGRLSELNGDKIKAIDYYEELDSKFPFSRWNSLAKSRIMILKHR